MWVGAPSSRDGGQGLSDPQGPPTAPLPRGSVRPGQELLPGGKQPTLDWSWPADREQAADANLNSLVATLTK